MRKYLLIFLFLWLWTNLFCQIDYLKIRDRYTLSCRKADSSELSINKKFLDSLSQFTIINGEEKFLNDLGMTYYKVYLKGKNLDDIIKSTESYQKCWDKYQNHGALWNLGTNYGILGNCDRKLELTELYIDHMKNNELEEYINYKQIYYRYKLCRNK